jgi:hypothetical protein
MVQIAYGAGVRGLRWKETVVVELWNSLTKVTTKKAQDPNWRSAVVLRAGLVTLFNNPKCFLVKILPASADRHSTLTFLVSFPRNYYKRLRSTPPFCSQHHNFCPYSPIDGRVREKHLASSTQRHM